MELALDEAQWVLRAREGQENSMRLLIERHRSRLVRVASNILRDANEAEDVAQESFLKAFRELDRLRDDQAFSGYVYRICVRLCMDRLRSRRAEPAEFESATADQGEAIENRVVIERLLDRLPYDLRVTLVLREVEQLSYDEIAEVLRVPVGTVRSRLHAAREKFRALWLEAVG
ncbi:MAG: RNA polymerase sigma factor [Fimbriimonadaceae bacterium]